MSTIIHSSPLPPIEDPAVHLSTYVLRKVDEVPDRLAICDAAGTSSFTFSELRHTVQSIAGGLQARGFGPGNVQAIMALNSPKYAAVIHGAAVAGGAVTMINPMYRENEIRFQLEDTAATVLFTGADFLQKAREASTGTTGMPVVPDEYGMATVASRSTTSRSLPCRSFTSTGCRP